MSEQLYFEENAALARSFFEDYYCKHFKLNDPDFRQIELVISPQCNLGCKYCYINAHRNDIFNPCLYNEEATIKNLQLILNWMDKWDYGGYVEIFSGELLAQKIGYEVLNIIYNHYKDKPKEKRLKGIVIPTNFTFVIDEKCYNQVLDFYKKFQDLEIEFRLSVSCDGMEMDKANRPFAHHLDIPFDVEYNDTYYDKVFELSKIMNTGFHPMIYSNNISKWIDNFNWFQKKFEEYNIPWNNLYLLTVRNQEWNKQDILDLRDFITYIFNWSYNNFDDDEDFLQWMKEDGFNILGAPFRYGGDRNHGMTCSIQKSLSIRVSDMAILPCHRLGYKDFIEGYLVEKDGDLDVEFRNPELHIAIQGLVKNQLPRCSECLIRNFCIGPCLGANYEFSKNLFCTPPTVCMVQYMAMKTILDNLHSHNLFHKFLKLFPVDYSAELIRIDNELKEYI